jgi:hypothetical protein
MKKNAQLHLVIEVRELNKLKAEAEEKKISLSELCRVKLRKNTQFDRIEGKLDKLLKNKKNNNEKVRVKTG